LRAYLIEKKHLSVPGNDSKRRIDFKHGDMVRASIIIPALNEEKRLAHSLPVIRAQLNTLDELIVVDNGING